MRLHGTIGFCLAAALVNSPFVCAETVTHVSAVACSKLIATGNPEYPPFLWRQSNQGDVLYGANRLIIDELSRRIDIPIQLKYVGPWSKALSDVKNGSVDMIAGAFYTRSRASYMDFFSPVMLHTTSVVWQRKNGGFPFRSKNDLENKWGVTVMNNSFGQSFDSFAQQHLNILFVASLETAFRMLVANRVDYVLYEKNPGIAYLSMLGMGDQVRAVQPSISSEGLYLTLSHESACNTPELRHRIAVALRDMRQDGFEEKALLEAVKAWCEYETKIAAALKHK